MNLPCFFPQPRVSWWAERGDGQVETEGPRPTGVWSWGGGPSPQAEWDGRRTLVHKQGGVGIWRLPSDGKRPVGHWAAKDTDYPVGPEKAPFLRFHKNGDLKG